MAIIHQTQEGEPKVTSNINVFIVVMGVAGTGKSTLGNALSEAFGVPYIEGDELHTKENIEKMSDGIPLTDTDREPWLKLMRTTAEEKAAASYTNSLSEDVSNKGKVTGVVAACSALKKKYRDLLRGKQKSETSEGTALKTFFVWIDGSKKMLEDRMKKRQGHYMKVSMLESQLNTLERLVEGEEDDFVRVPLEATPEEQLNIALEGLRKLFV